MKDRTCDNQSEPCFLSVSATIFCENFVISIGHMDSEGEDEISGHSTVEQATTVSFTEIEER